MSARRLEPLGRARDVGTAGLQPHLQLAADEAHNHLPCAVRRGRNRDRARARRAGLPHAALPDARRYTSRFIDARNLDVGSLRKPGMPLEQRADPLDLRRIALDDRVRVADRDGYELDALEPLARADLDRPEILLDQTVCDARR